MSARAASVAGRTARRVLPPRPPARRVVALLVVLLVGFSGIVARLVQRESFVLALQDAFLLTVGVVVLAIIALAFVRRSRQPATPLAPAGTAPAEEGGQRQMAFAD